MDAEERRDEADSKRLFQLCYSAPEVSGSDAQASLATAEMVRKTIEGHQTFLAGRKFPAGALTVSIGIALCIPEGARDQERVGEELFRAADEALYAAKQEGRNLVRLNAGTRALPQARRNYLSS